MSDIAVCPQCDNEFATYDAVQECYRCHQCGAGWDEEGLIGDDYEDKESVEETLEKRI